MSSRHNRHRHIAAVLLRHTWAYLLGVVGLDRSTAVDSGSKDRHQAHTPAEHLRLVLEELGPTFIKLGQSLSTRPDLLSPAYRFELAKLQDAAPSLPDEVVREVIRAELGRDPETAFASFDLDPLAAASIGQAHAATLDDGTEVVVKIRRPGAVEQVEQDLEILKRFAAHASRHWESAALYDLVGLADEYAHTLRAQLDYLQEARNAERFAVSFAAERDVQIPRVFWETTTSRVITLERVRGMKITDLEALEAAGVDRHELAQRATRLVAQMVFEHGFFHADPHPGNFFIQPSGAVAIIDFGMVGALDDALRAQLGRFLIALVRQDPERLASALLELSVAPSTVDQARLRDDLAVLLHRYSSEALGDIELGKLIGELLEILRRHRLRVRRDLALLVRAFIIDEGIAAELDPEFRLIDALAPYAYRHLAAQFSPAVLPERLEHAALGLVELAFDLPDRLQRLLEAIDSGALQVRLPADDLEPLVARTERVGNRITASVCAAAVILASFGLYASRRISR
jgi:ubiquinone biosynthesis protein